MLRQLFPQAPPAIEIELTARLLSSSGGIGLVGLIAGVTGTQAALNRDLVPATLLLMIFLVALARLIGLPWMRQLQGQSPRDLAGARRSELGYGLGSCLTSLLLGITNLHVLSYRDPALTLLVVCGFCCYIFSLILRTAVRPLVCLSSIGIALIPTIAGLISSLDYGTRLSPVFALMALVTIAAVIALASVQLTGHLYRTTLDQLMAQRDLIRFARRDPLTGLNNRLALREHFETLLSQPTRLVALLYLDLDGFKPVNDLHGHQIGDALLSQVAVRLSALLGPVGHAFRVGGDEFIVLLTRVRHRGDATEMARRLTFSLSEPYAFGPTTVWIGASIGMALADSGVADLDGLMARADAALYDAKQSGRGTFRVSNDSSSPRLPPS